MTLDLQNAGRSARLIVLVEFKLPGQSFRVCNWPSGFEDEEYFWRPGLKHVSPLTRSLDPVSRDLRVSDVLMEIEFGAEQPPENILDLLLQEQVFENSELHISVAEKLDDGTIISAPVLVGMCIPVSVTSGSLVCKARYVQAAKLGPLHRTVNTLAFPNAPDYEVGKATNIVCGNQSSVYLPCIDDRNTGPDFPRFLVSQHPVKAVSAVYRKRSEAWTQLSSGDWTALTRAVDGEGRDYAYIQLSNTANGAQAHQERDQYFADVEGLPKDGYVSLDGNNDYLRAAAPDSPSVPGRSGVTGAFTVEVKFNLDAAGSWRALAAIWSGAGSSDKSWWLGISNANKIRFQFSDNGTDFFYADGDSVISAGCDYIVRAIFQPDLEPRIWVNGQEQSLSTTGSLQGELHVSADYFSVGANSNGSNKFVGKIHYLILAREAQPLGAGSSCDRAQPLEDVFAEWRFFCDGGADLVGDNALTGISLGPADYSCLQGEDNPSFFVDAVLRWRYFWRFPGDSVNRSSIGAASDACVDRNYTSGFACLLPIAPGAAEAKRNQWRALQEICCNFAHSATIDKNGRLRLVGVDFSSTNTSGDLVIYDQDSGDFDDSGVKIDLHPFDPRTNLARASCALNHRDGFTGELKIMDIASQQFYGPSEEQLWQYPMIQSEQMLQDVTNRRMLNLSGNARMLSFTVPGLWGLQDGSDLGDVISIKYPGLHAAIADKQALVTGVRADLLNGTVTLAAFTLGDQLGPVSFKSQQTVELVAVQDTFVSAQSAAASFGDMHVVCFSYDDETRWALRFDLSEIPAGATILSASLRLYGTAVGYPNRDGGLPIPGFRELLSTTWSESSTYSSFDSAGGWDDNSHVGASDLAALIVWGVGFRSYEFNSSGISYLADHVAGGDAGDCKAQFTAQRRNQAEAGESYTAASRQHANALWRPTLVVTYSA